MKAARSLIAGEGVRAKLAELHVASLLIEPPLGRVREQRASSDDPPPLDVSHEMVAQPPSFSEIHLAERPPDRSAGARRSGAGIVDPAPEVQAPLNTLPIHGHRRRKASSTSARWKTLR